MVDVLIVGVPQGLPPGIVDLLEREFVESCQCELEKDLENANKQNLELLRKVDELEKEYDAIKIRNCHLVKRNLELGLLKAKLNESESRYNAALEAGKYKDDEIKRLKKPNQLLTIEQRMSIAKVDLIKEQARELKIKNDKAEEMAKKEEV